MTPHPPVSVVVADDDQRFLRALVELFDDEPGFEVLGSATTTTALLDLVRAHHPDVAVVDVRMPGGGAPEAAEAMHALCPSTALVALSAHADRSAAMHLASLGAIGPLKKGLPAAELLAIVAAASASRR